MSRFLLSVRANGGDPTESMTPDAVRAGYEQIEALEAEMKAANAFVFGGRLHEPDTATVVDASGDDITTTDGPFIESKEGIGGFYIIDAEDLDTALRWASKTSAVIHMPIEVRPFWDSRTA